VVGVVDGGPAEIDGDLTAGLPQLGKRLLVLDQEPLNEEGCVEPGPVQGRHEHAHGELIDCQLLFQPRLRIGMGTALIDAYNLGIDACDDGVLEQADAFALRGTTEQLSAATTLLTELDAK
jgi:hypothetical protein